MKHAPTPAFPSRPTCGRCPRASLRRSLAPAATRGRTAPPCCGPLRPEWWQKTVGCLSADSRGPRTVLRHRRGTLNHANLIVQSKAVCVCCQSIEIRGCMRMLKLALWLIACALCVGNFRLARQRFGVGARADTGVVAQGNAQGVLSEMNRATAWILEVAPAPSEMDHAYQLLAKSLKYASPQRKSVVNGRNARRFHQGPRLPHRRRAAGDESLSSPADAVGVSEVCAPLRIRPLVARPVRVQNAGFQRPTFDARRRGLLDTAAVVGSRYSCHR